MKELFVQPNSSIKKALKQMGRGAEKCLIVIDKEGVLLGTLSDGDLRTAILSGVEMNLPIDNFYNKDSTFFKNNQSQVNGEDYVIIEGQIYHFEELEDILLQYQIDQYSINLHCLQGIK